MKYMQWLEISTFINSVILWEHILSIKLQSTFSKYAEYGIVFTYMQENQKEFYENIIILFSGW